MYQISQLVFALALVAVPRLDAAQAQAQQQAEPVTADTAWVDSPNPIFTPSALQQLNKLWSSRQYRGACLRGEVRKQEGLGDAPHVTRVSSADFPDLCSGYKSVGAAVFRYPDRAADSDSSEAACRLLVQHPEWAVAAVMTGLGHSKLRGPDGKHVVTTRAPIASYCAWLRKKPDQPDLANPTAH